MADEQTAAPVAPATPAVKPAWQTTEFWLNAIAQIVGVAMTICGMLNVGPNSKIQIVLGLAATLLSATGHTVSRTIIKTSVILLCFLILSGCSTIDRATLQEFQSGEVLILKDMSTYIAADVAAGKAPAFSQADLDAHLAKVNTDVRSVDPAEEQRIMAQFLAYLAADTKISTGTMKAWGGEVKAHMDLFTSVHR